MYSGVAQTAGVEIDPTTGLPSVHQSGRILSQDEWRDLIKSTPGAYDIVHDRNPLVWSTAGHGEQRGEYDKMYKAYVATHPAGGGGVLPTITP